MIIQLSESLVPACTPALVLPLGWRSPMPAHLTLHEDPIPTCTSASLLHWGRLCPLSHKSDLMLG